jgi:hypothetical protein
VYSQHVYSGADLANALNLSAHEIRLRESFFEGRSKFF